MKFFLIKNIDITVFLISIKHLILKKIVELNILYQLYLISINIDFKYN